MRSKLLTASVIALTFGLSLNTVYASAAYIPADLEKFEKTHSCVGCDLSEVKLTWGDYSSADFTNALLVKATLCADFYTTNFTGARLMYSHIHIQASGSNFSGADLTGASLINSNFTSSNFKGAKLTGADLTDTNLASTNLTPEQLASAESLSCAILPDGSQHAPDSGRAC
ncbi:MAG: pentapeptide repeat-containing protein [Gammaproteobacteria bacterium]